jgi:glutathione S-transferase
VISLHAFAPLWGLADVSPFVTKVDVYLRLAKLPYKLVPFSMEAFGQAPKGKLPYIVDGKEKIADSGFIVDYLKRFIKTLPNLMQYWDRLSSRLYKSQTE